MPKATGQRPPRAILLNLLNTTLGGGITRAHNFVKRFKAYAPDTRLILLKDKSLALGEVGSAWKTISVDIGRGRAARRMLWENAFVPRVMRHHGCDLYLTFSHFTPWSLPKEHSSIVCVSNLAPFSEAARKEERTLAGRLRLELLKRSVIASARRATRVIALSHECKRKLLESAIPEHKIFVVPNGVEIPGAPVDRAGLTKFHELGIRRPYLLYVSHFYPYKNFIRLLDAYSQLPQQLQNAYRLVLVGIPYVDRYFREVLQHITRSNLADNVVLIPGLGGPALHAVYANATSFVFPSLIENSPNILLEAMAHRLPIVVGRIEPMPEFAGDAGLYFDPFSAQDCARAICTVLSDENLRQAMREKSAARARMYSWDDFTAKVVALCNVPISADDATELK